MNKIIILDKNMVQKALICNWVSFSFVRQLNGTGSFELVINANDKQAGYIDDGDILYYDDEICGYINHMEVVSEESCAKEKLTITGIELKDIISHRVIVPDAGNADISYTTKTTGYIAADLIDRCMINPVDTARKMDNLSVLSNSLGGEIDYSVRYKQLDSEIYSLLAMHKLGLKGIVDLENKGISMQVFEGVDRTYGQNANIRAIFSIRLNTLRTASTILDCVGYKTIGYIGGAGEGTDREVVTRYNDSNAVGWDRKEIFVDVSDAKTSEELLDKGSQRMLEIDKAYSITGDAYDNSKMVYELGDIVTVEDRFGNMDDVQITSIEYSMSGSAPTGRKVTFGKAPDTLAQVVNRRLYSINNILTN